MVKRVPVRELVIVETAELEHLKHGARIAFAYTCCNVVPPAEQAWYLAESARRRAARGKKPTKKKV